MEGSERQEKMKTAFESTPIYDETLREALMEKADVKKAKEIFSAVQAEKIKVSTVVRGEKPSPFAYHILMQYADVSEFMAPEHVILSNIDRMKNAIQARTATLLCIHCGEWVSKQKVADLPEQPKCGNCGSQLLTILYQSQDANQLRDFLKLRREGKNLEEENLKELSLARRKADLILSYGKQAVVALQVKGVGAETASRILGKMHTSEDEFYLDLLKAKIQYLRTIEFWDSKERR